MQPIIVGNYDCQDDEAKIAFKVRAGTKFPGSQIEYGKISHSIQAAGFTIREIDASEDATVPIIIANNRADRTEKAMYPNGVPFCYALYNKAIVIGPLSSFLLMKKLGMLKTVFEVDVFNVCRKFFSLAESRRKADSQYRGYDFVIDLMHFLHCKEDVPVEKEVVIPDMSVNYVWHTDEFGGQYGGIKVNCKTTCLDKSEFTNQRLVALPYVEILGNLSPNQGGITKGSTGIRASNQMFLEVAICGASAAKEFNLAPGVIV